MLRARPHERAGNVGRVRVSRAGQPGGRHGQGARRGVCRGPAGVRRGRRGARRPAQHRHVGGAGGTGDAHRERAAGLVAVSLAAMRVLETEAGVDLRRDAQFVAGHSVGEYSALVATGARWPMRCGWCASAAVPCSRRCRSASARWRRSLVDFDQAAAIAAEAAQGEVVQAANDNGGGQVVVSGHRAAVERAVEIAKAKGVRRAMMLPVSGPFHSALMQPAADVMADALAKVTIKPPSVPLVANVLAQPTLDPAQIVRGLIDQVTGNVRWRESIAFMAAAGVTTFYEVGSGKVLSGLVKRIAEGASGMPIGTPADVAAFKAMQQQGS